MTDGQEVRAARRVARAEPVTVSLGSESLTFVPELPVDVVFAYDTLSADTRSEVQVWTVAHLLVDSPCDTSCAEEGLPFRERRCPAEKELRRRIRGARVDGRRLTQVDIENFHTEVLGHYAVDEGESPSSAELPAQAGERSSGTPSEPGSISTGSGDQATEAPAA